VTEIQSDLIMAYEATDFRVLEPQSVTLRVGQYSAELHALYVESLTNAGYRSFSSSVASIRLQRNGQSEVYRVPIGQRGALADHAERSVHVACIDRIYNYSRRLFAFSEVSQTGPVVRSAKKEAK
jgi:hypothetical protein